MLEKVAFCASPVVDNTDPCQNIQTLVRILHTCPSGVIRVLMLAISRLLLPNFLDGTVEGIPADLTVYRDDYTPGWQYHDRTYYGNGCPNGWGTDGAGGSITPCSTRIIKNKDNERQKNGTYYTFPAITVGIGGGMETDNTNTPDTFCPLGWQLPYSGTGGDYYDKSKSWIFLVESYGYSHDQNSDPDGEKLKHYPFSFVSGGHFWWILGRLYTQNEDGDNSTFLWSSTLKSNIGAYRLDTWSVGIKTGVFNNKVDSIPVRCDFDISSLEKLSMASA